MFDETAPLDFFFTGIENFHYVHYSKACLKQPLKRRPKLVFKTDYRLMQVKGIAECSNGEHSAILLTCIKR